MNNFVKNILILNLILACVSSVHAETLCEDDVASVPMPVLDQFTLPSIYLGIYSGGSAQAIIFENNTQKNAESELEVRQLLGFGMHVPIYQNYIQYGINFRFSEIRFNKSDSINKYLQNSHYSSDTIENSVAGVILDATFSLKAQMPIMNMVSIFGEGEVGLSTAQSFLVFNENKTSTELIRKTPKLGAIYGGGAGVDLYPLEWIGFYIKASMFYYNYFDSNGINDQLMRNDEPLDIPESQKAEIEKRKSGFWFQTDRLVSFGINVTF